MVWGSVAVIPVRVYHKLMLNWGIVNNSMKFDHSDSTFSKVSISISPNYLKVSFRQIQWLVFKSLFGISFLHQWENLCLNSQVFSLSRSRELELSALGSTFPTVIICICYRNRPPSRFLRGYTQIAKHNYHVILRWHRMYQNKIK